MYFNIKIFSTPGCDYKESVFTDLKKLRKEYYLRITRLENIGTLDIKHLLDAIYNGFDGIFVIIRGELKEGKFLTEYNSFQKVVDETNKILGRRGFTDQRIGIIHWNGSDIKKLYEEIKNCFKKIMKCGKNPINNEIQDLKNFSKENSIKQI
ncbi:MAG: hydrogenase iron-sulfur subunit [Promethearchaeota archaeon]